MFHNRQFRTLVMSPFFRLHDLYEDITLDDIRLPFHSQRYPTDRESDFDTRMTPTYSVESNPSEPSYLTYSVGSYHSESSHPSMIHLSSYSFASLAASTAPPVRGRRFIRTRAVPRGRGRTRGGGCGDNAPGGYGNGYLSFDG